LGCKVSKHVAHWQRCPAQHEGWEVPWGLPDFYSVLVLQPWAPDTLLKVLKGSWGDWREVMSVGLLVRF